MHRNNELAAVDTSEPLQQLSSDFKYDSCRCSVELHVPSPFLGAQIAFSTASSVEIGNSQQEVTLSALRAYCKSDCRDMMQGRCASGHLTCEAQKSDPTAETCEVADNTRAIHWSCDTHSF